MCPQAALISGHSTCGRWEWGVSMGEGEGLGEKGEAGKRTDGDVGQTTESKTVDGAETGFLTDTEGVVCGGCKKRHGEEERLRQSPSSRPHLASFPQLEGE